ncbi:MAG: c-type cytochrome [Planctomycetales bacterium]|nr:c-type cytochrome [Planctomycetales bacterium]
MNPIIPVCIGLFFLTSPSLAWCQSSKSYSAPKSHLLQLVDELGSGLSEGTSSGTKTALPQIDEEEIRSAVRTTEPLSADLERQSFVLPEGFEIELVASEPDIAKPMNLAFDSKGRLWVSSSAEYPYPAAEGEGKDTIKVIEDADGDGIFERITTFADGLNIPIGLYPYADGVVCYSIPNIWFLRDTDGDGHCDRREILYGPFDYSRDTHGMCNGFRRGFDGWLYACHGFNNRSTVSGRDGHSVTMSSGNTFRIKLDGSRIEHFTKGQVNPFGMAMDTFGDLFTADCHTKPITLLIQGGEYEGFGRPHDGLGFVPNVMEHLHGSTAIGGIALYQASQFPSEYLGNSFGGNVMTSRVNRNSIEHVGSTVRAHQEADFVVSRDPWFRPVDLQVGPDGALYIADFYNRIIGHYEVALDHPGRDRHRGRIWRVVFRGHQEANRNASLTATKDTDSLKSALAKLSSNNLIVRQLATDQIVDNVGQAAIEALNGKLNSEVSGEARVQLLWALYRLDALTEAQLIASASDANELVRAHVQQLVGSMNQLDTATQEIVLNGLNDTSPMVQRFAAIAAGKQPSERLALQLLEVLQRVPSEDLHLRHALRISLRDQLAQNAQFFETVTKRIGENSIVSLADICLGIRKEFAADFVVTHFRNLGSLSPRKLEEYAQYLAQYASPNQIPEIVDLLQDQVSPKLKLQDDLIRSVLLGLAQRKHGMIPEVQTWAEQIARECLGLKGDAVAETTPATLEWRALDGTSGQSVAVWQVTTVRNSADGLTSTPLFSSFPNGETRTGVYRSDTFELPSSFSFYLAGHDGVPAQPLQGLNLVRIRDAVTEVVLKQWSPPRNDTAQLISWVTDEFAGRRAFVELVDGDSGQAYAWLAAGRFSVEGLNPGLDLQDKLRGAQLVADFQLKSLRDDVRKMLLNPKTPRELSRGLGRALAKLEPMAVREALAESLAVVGVDLLTRSELVDSLAAEAAESDHQLIKKVMLVATSGEQKRIALALASDRPGVQLLIELIEQGVASPRLLVDASTRDKVDRLASPEQIQSVTQLISDLPNEDAAILASIDQLKTLVSSKAGDEARGKLIFVKNCSACHQLAGQGTAVGPNLDGIGSRGLERLLEDVWLPNRNVDAAFRSTVLLLSDGSVMSGFVKSDEGPQILLVDNTGRELRVSQDEVEDRKTVRTSPMPANFHETLMQSDAADLFEYLLSLVK